MAVKLECSIPLPVVTIDAAVEQKRSLVPSFCKFRFKRQSEVVAEDKMHTETVVDQKNLKVLKVNEDYVVASDANVAKLISHICHSNVGAEKFKLSAGEPEVGVMCFPKKNEDSGLRKTYTEDCLVVDKSNSPDPRTRSGENFSRERETTYRRLCVASDDNRQTVGIILKLLFCNLS